MQRKKLVVPLFLAALAVLVVSKVMRTHEAQVESVSQGNANVAAEKPDLATALPHEGADRGPVPAKVNDAPAQAEDTSADAPASLPANNPTGATTANEEGTGAQDVIQEKFASARQAFQQKDSIAQAKPEEVHHTPKVTIEAARQLGEIVELQEKHPEQAASFRDFYLECARDEKNITVTRAQCLDKYVKTAKLDAAAKKQLLQDFSEDVVRLFDALQ